VTWDLTRTPREQARPQPGQPRPGGRPETGSGVPPGVYRVVLTVDGKGYSQSLKVENDPTAPGGVIAEEPEEPKKEPPVIDD